MKTIPPPDGVEAPITPIKARRLIDALREWEREVIRAEYRRLLRGMTKDEAIKLLSRRHARSEGSIDHIVYPRTKLR